MKIRDILNNNISLDDIFETQLVELHRNNIEKFTQLCESDLLISFFLSDTDERYTLSLTSDDATMIEGEAIDFPIVTLYARRADWKTFQAMVQPLVDRLEEKHDKSSSTDIYLTEKMLAAYEKFDGAINVRLNDKLNSAVCDFSIILNDYESSDDFPTINVEISLADILEAVENNVSLSHVVKSLAIRGDKAFILKLGGFLQSLSQQ